MYVWPYSLSRPHSLPHLPGQRASVDGSVKAMKIRKLILLLEKPFTANVVCY